MAEVKSPLWFTSAPPRRKPLVQPVERYFLATFPSIKTESTQQEYVEENTALEHSWLVSTEQHSEIGLKAWGLENLPKAQKPKQAYTWAKITALCRSKAISFHLNLSLFLKLALHSLCPTTIWFQAFTFFSLKKLHSMPLLFFSPSPPIICIFKDCWFVFKQISGKTHTEHITGGKGCSKYTMQLCSKRSPCKEPKAIKDTNTTEHAQHGSLGAQQC